MNKCGMCKHAKYNGVDFLCENEESHMYGLETDYNESCIDYEQKSSDEDD